MGIWDFTAFWNRFRTICHTKPGCWKRVGETERRKASAVPAAILFATVFGGSPAVAGVSVTPYRKMAPVVKYLIADERAEIALARSAAPDSIARGAEVLVLRKRGFQTAVKGENGFVCMVARSWTSGSDSDFWDPRVQVPMCFNAAAARSYLQYYLKKTDAVLSGHSREQVGAIITSAVAKGQLPSMASGAMCYMLSKRGYGGVTIPHWPPHLMFFYPDIDIGFWGANLPGSPVFAMRDRSEHVTSFVVVVQRWSDGTDGAPKLAVSAGRPGPHNHVLM